MIKNKYKIAIGLLGIIFILSFVFYSFHVAELTTDSDVINPASFYGIWKVEELSWYDEDYYTSDTSAKEMQEKIHEPIDDFFITIEAESYIETEHSSNYNSKINKPQYRLETYDMSTEPDSLPIDNVFFLKPCLETLNLTDKPIECLVVRDPIKDKMDSGEIDWYYVATPIFIFVDTETILFTGGDCLEIYKCKRVSKKCKEILTISNRWKWQHEDLRL